MSEAGNRAYAAPGNYPHPGAKKSTPTPTGGSRINIPFKLEKTLEPGYRIYTVDRDDFPPLRLIERRGKIVAAVGRYYELIPLEEVEEVVTKAAESLELQKFRHFDTGTRLYSFYLSPWEETFSDGSRVQVGIYALNSIDGSTRLQFDIFTYRNLCQNVIMLALTRLRKGMSLMEVKKMVKELRGEDADFGAIGHIAVTHTKKGVREWKKMRESIEALLPLGRKILQIYRRWEEEHLTEETVEKLVENRVPIKFLRPVASFNKKGEIEEVTVDNLFDAYQQITQGIWHSKAQIRTKAAVYKRLHQVLLAPELEVRP